MPLTRMPERGLAAIGLALLGLTVAGVALHERGQLGIGSDRRRVAFMALFLLAGGLYLLAVRLVQRAPLPPRAVWLVLGVAVLLRGIVLPAPAFLSNDINRYVWDGRVQLAGINPYRYLPADPALAALRDATVFPFINRADTARTIYPPLAQMLFFAVQWLHPGVIGVKMAMAGAEAAAVGALLALLHRAGRPAAQILVYAWHPLPVWEFAGNGHVDALAIACVALALLAVPVGEAGQPGAARRRTLAGMALASAVMAKILPGVLLPALWRGRGWRLPAAFVATIAAGYLVYSSAGAHVLGFLPGYAAEEGIADGQGIFFLTLLGALIALPGWAGLAYLAALLAALGGLGARMMRQLPAGEDAAAGTRRLARDALLLATLLTVALTRPYPWYFAWLLVPACIVPAPAVLFLTVASVTLYQNPTGSRLLWPLVLYGPFAALLLRAAWRRRPTHREKR